MALLPGVLSSLFETENNSFRFERVSIDLYRAAEGVELVPTSRTYDRGRDGRSISIESPEFKAVLCASLSADIDDKIESDIKRLLETTKTKAIVFCSSRCLSEQMCDIIEAKIREIYPHAESIRVLGRHQLIALGERNEGIIRQHYPGEIKAIEEVWLQDRKALSEPEELGLRLAMLTQTGDDAKQLRQELSQRLVLEALNSNGPQSSGHLATAISGQLHLPRSISKVYIDEILEKAKRENLVNIKNGTVEITEKGIDSIYSISPEATMKLLEGRTAIRNTIKELTGHRINDMHYEQVWNCLKDGLSDLFYSHGMSIVQMVSSLITGESTKIKHTQSQLFERLGDRVGALFSDPDQRNDITQAIIDMLAEKESDAFKWLAQICIVYVMMCSLGFEAMSSQQVTRLLRYFQLVPDTDIIISLLCEKEDNHEEVDRIISGWKMLGGKLLMSRHVLEEVAYHAWISNNEYNNVKEQLKKMSTLEARRLLENAFLRTFRILCSEKDINNRNWTKYISQFRGESERDYGNIMQILRDEFGFEILPDADEDYQGFTDQVRDVSIKIASDLAACDPEDFSPEGKDKCARDGLLVSAVKAARDSARQSGRRTIVIILSSARSLRQIDEVFRKQLGKPDAVVSTAAIGCLLTLTPGVQMGLGTLRGVLFDLGLVKRVAPYQRTIYRLIAASGQFEVPWSRRITLQNELMGRILEDARDRGERPKEAREKILRFENPERSARIVVETLDRMAVSPKTEDELRKYIDSLKGEIEKLEDQLRAKKVGMKK